MHQKNTSNMHPRKIQWNENSIKCSFKNGNVRTYQYGNKLVTKFAASEPIIPGGFTCGLVGTVVGRAFQQLKSSLLVDVEIFETRVFASANGNILLKMQTKLHSVEADTLIPGYHIPFSFGLAISTEFQLDAYQMATYFNQML